MGLVLKHVERTKSGSWQYRRRVPKEVSEVIAKREFKRKLGESEREALAAYPRYHAEVEREIAEAMRGKGRAAVPRDAVLSGRESEPSRSSVRMTCDADHWPPRGVMTPEAFSAPAISLRDFSAAFRGSNRAATFCPLASAPA
jgi:hypothetical protein